MSKLEIGLIAPLNQDMEQEFDRLVSLDFHNCQLNCWQEDLLTKKYAELVNQALKKREINISAFWCGWPGPAHWNFQEGPVTLGLVPEVYQFERMKVLKKGSDFARAIAVDKVVTHVGFIPENPNKESYKRAVEAVKDVARHCQQNGQKFLFETGQETPITLLRLIEDVGLDNLGINLDPANLLMYGKANPVDALDVFGEYVQGVHAKDGEYPVSGDQLGPEKPLGEGRVDFPVLIKKLKELGYEGTLTIEREISGAQQLEDIKKGREYLQQFI
ncbi:MAG: sugar phosphate isomerase/epimerase family protein [Bacillota bacterium]